MEILGKSCHNLTKIDVSSVTAIKKRFLSLAKPVGSLGCLEKLVEWLGGWQGTDSPSLDRVKVIVFAANHGIARHSISPFPARVTEQIVANCRSGGAAINQLCKVANADLEVIPIFGLDPTQDMARQPAMTEHKFIQAISFGYKSVSPTLDLLTVGEMGIGNTTAASAVAAAIFGGPTRSWCGKGSGATSEILRKKIKLVQQALQLHHDRYMGNPLEALRCLGGYEMAALLGAVLAARHYRIPVLLDGFICCSAVGALFKIDPKSLDHCLAANLSAEKGHRRLLTYFNKKPLLSLQMKLGEASGAAIAIPVFRQALACYYGMATYKQLEISVRDSFTEDRN